METDLFHTLWDDSKTRKETAALIRLYFPKHRVSAMIARCKDPNFYFDQSCGQNPTILSLIACHASGDDRQDLLCMAKAIDKFCVNKPGTLPGMQSVEWQIAALKKMI